MRHPLWRASVFLVIAALPLYWLYQAWIFALGPDPGKVLVERLGTGALVLLLITLAMTPLQKLTAWNGWIVVRRQLGLWSFFYALLHLGAYTVFILGLDWGQLTVELRRRPYIIVGLLALIGMLPLALTSNGYSQRRMGASWKNLHRLSYPVLLLGLLHMLWIVRADLREWAMYAALGAALLLLRVPAVRRRIPRLPKRRTRLRQ